MRRRTKAMEETKQQRQLLNHQRYLGMWDAHESQVQKHFKEKEDLEESIFGTSTLKFRKMSKALNRQPKIIQQAVKDITDPALTPNERLMSQLKVISLAKTMAQPRPDSHD